MIDLEWVRELIDLVDESEIDTLEVSRFATRVRISKSPPVHSSAPPAPARAADLHAASGEPGAGSEAPGGAAAVEEAPSPAEGAAEQYHEVTSPMVGTFYRAPAPDAPPYVEEGEGVQTGQTLCILEAMKLMNELESEVSGVIREICVDNAEAVEYGQVLFRIDTSA